MRVSPSRKRFVWRVQPDVNSPRSQGGCAALSRGNDRQQQMRRPLRIVINAMHRRAAGADMIRHVFRIGRAADPGRQVEAGDVETDAMTAPEQVGG